MTEPKWERHNAPNGEHIWCGEKHIADITGEKANEVAKLVVESHNTPKDTKTPEGVTFQPGWEDGENCSVEELICSCGANLLLGYTEYTASSEDIMECPKCGSKYQFIWMGMTIKRLK